MIGKVFDHLSVILPGRRNVLRQYLYVTALMTVALLARLSIAPLDGGVQYVTFFPAVAISAVIGGLWPGLFAALIGVALATYLFWPPYQAITFEFQRDTIISNAVFLLDAVLVCSSIEAMHRYYHKFAGILAEHKRTSDALAESEREFHTLADNVPDNIVRCDLEGRVLFINRTLEATQGRPAAELIGKTARENFPDGRFAALDAAIRQVGTTGISTEMEQLVPAADGSLRYHLVHIVAEKGPDGNPVSVLAVGRDMTVQKQAEDALRLADQRKDEFLAMLAHELRNPLVPIRNVAHVIGRLGKDEPKLQWAHGLLEEQVNHLARLVEDLLDVSRIVRGKTTLKKSEIEFTGLARQALEAARPLLDGRGHQLTVRLPEQPVYLDADPVRLTQVLSNLLDNAAKYTPEGGKIAFEADAEGQELAIRVSDDGVGIPADLQPHVFDLFQQGERTLDRSQGGLGIGLTLVRRLAEMHGGRVEVHSDGPGQGASFTVRLPIKPAYQPAMAQGDRSAATDIPGIRVLVVDDDLGVADSTAVLLEMEGHGVRIAHSGQEALELVPGFRPQAVLLDIGLQGMDGIETARRLRQLPEGKGLLLLAMSGYGDEGIKSAALSAGCDHYLVKPVAFTALNELLAGAAVKLH